MPRQRKPPSSTKRPAGKPRRAERAIGPAELAEIEERFLRNEPRRKTAEALGVAVSTVAHHLDHTIRPSLQERADVRLEDDVARVAHLESFAWQQFRKSETPKVERRRVKKQLLHKGLPVDVAEQVLTKISRDGQVGWIAIVQWCIDWRCKIGGHYIDRKEIALRSEMEFRVGGMTPGEVNEAMLERLAESIERIAAREKGTANWDEARNPP